VVGARERPGPVEDLERLRVDRDDDDVGSRRALAANLEADVDRVLLELVQEAGGVRCEGERGRDQTPEDRQQDTSRR